MNLLNQLFNRRNDTAKSNTSKALPPKANQTQNELVDNSQGASQKVMPPLKQQTITIHSLDEKGYGIARLPSGTLVGVLGALPGEVVEVEIWSRRKHLYLANLIRIVTPSLDRIQPEEDAYLSTSPLQIMTAEGELKWKKSWINKQFANLDTKLPHFEIQHDTADYGYRNKVEFSFFGDENGLHLAFHKRSSSKGKIIVDGCKLLPAAVDETAQRLRDWLSAHDYTARQLKGLLIKYSFNTNTMIAALYCKDLDIHPTHDELASLMDDKLIGVSWIYSDHRAPDMRMTQLIHELGQTKLSENINGLDLDYPFDGFFQVNPNLFIKTITDLRTYIQSHIPDHSSLALLDLYAGVGTIGLSLADLFAQVTGVETHPKSQEFATQNAKQNAITNYDFHLIPAETLDGSIYENRDVVVVDPPRSGLMPAVVEQLLANKPKYIFYLSCNCATQARDITLLSKLYKIDTYSAYNYYPRTMHVEGLAVMKLKK